MPIKITNRTILILILFMNCIALACNSINALLTPTEINAAGIIPSTPIFTEIPSGILSESPPILYEAGATNRYESPFGFTFEYPAEWILRESQEALTAVQLTSYDPASPPHKLEWDQTTIRIDIWTVGDAEKSFDAWVMASKEEAIAAHLSIFAETRGRSMNGHPFAQFTLVSGSGGVIERILVDMDGVLIELEILGNMELASTVLNSIAPLVGNP